MLDTGGHGGEGEVHDIEGRLGEGVNPQIRME